jgi:hypothetical protein
MSCRGRLAGPFDGDFLGWLGQFFVCFPFLLQSLSEELFQMSAFHNAQLAARLSLAKSLSPYITIRGFLPVWRKLFGLGLHADSSTGERCSHKT